MKLWEIEDLLQHNVHPFQSPKIQYEQYITTPHLAAHTLFTANQSYDDIENKTILDLGTGTGMLSIGSCLLGAKQVFGVDIDEDALNICQQNISNVEKELEETFPIELLQCDALQFEQMIKKRFKDNNHRIFDTILMNPPFGTRVKGADMMFLKIATELSNNAIYSLHKTSTRNFVTAKAATWGFDVKVVAELNYDLEASYSFHKKKSQQIQVDLIRLQRKKQQTKQLQPKKQIAKKRP